MGGGEARSTLGSSGPGGSGHGLAGIHLDTASPGLGGTRRSCRTQAISAHSVSMFLERPSSLSHIYPFVRLHW